MGVQYRMRKFPEYKATAREVVKILSDKPHLLVRIVVSGDYFPHRAVEPFVMIRTGEHEYFKGLFTDVSPDNQQLLGYLPINIPPRGDIVFGYGNEIWGVVPGDLAQASVARLDRKKLPKDVKIVDDNYLRNRKRR